MKRIYTLTREKVVYYRKEVELDTDNWEQIGELLEGLGIDANQYQTWAVVPVDIQQQIIEYFESNLEDEDLTDDECYDTEEWCEANEFDLEQVVA